APTSYVATARVAPQAEAGVQDAVVRALPNVTAIPLRDVLERLGRVLDQMAVAGRALARFALSTRLVVLVGGLRARRSPRVGESVSALERVGDLEDARRHAKHGGPSLRRRVRLPWPGRRHRWKPARGGPGLGGAQVRARCALGARATGAGARPGRSHRGRARRRKPGHVASPRRKAAPGAASPVLRDHAPGPWSPTSPR